MSPRLVQDHIITSTATQYPEPRPKSMTSLGIPCPRTGPLLSNWGRFQNAERKIAKVHQVWRIQELWQVCEFSFFSLSLHCKLSVLGTVKVLLQKDKQLSTHERTIQCLLSQYLSCWSLRFNFLTLFCNVRVFCLYSFRDLLLSLVSHFVLYHL